MEGPSLYETNCYCYSMHLDNSYRVFNNIVLSVRHLSARSLSEQDAGQKYKYQILFKLRSCKDVELILYSDQLYKSISAVFFTRFMEKYREYYRFRYQGKVYMIPKEEVETIEFTRSWNIGWW